MAALPSMLYLGLLIVLVFYIYGALQLVSSCSHGTAAVVGVLLFKANDPR